MTKVRIEWEEVVSYSQVFEIEDFNPGHDYFFQDKLTDAIAEHGDDLNNVEEVSDREVINWQMVPDPRRLDQDTVQRLRERQTTKEGMNED